MRNAQGSMAPLLRCLLLLTPLFFVAATARETAPRPVPDARNAVIDGKVAVGAWPTRHGEIVGPEGFTVHLTGEAELERERVHPAGSWFQPPPGRYRIWLEGADPARGGRPYITPGFSLLRFRGGPFRGRGVVSRHEVVPAGEVVLSPRHPLPEGGSLHLLQVEPVAFQGRPTRGFLRALPAGVPGKPVLMPAGRMIGLVYDRETRRYVAASPVVNLPAASRVRVEPAARSGVSDLLVILRRGRAAETVEEAAIEVRAERPDGKRLAPDVLVPSRERVYALWYDAGSRSLRVDARSKTGYLESTEVVLRPGGLATLRADLRPRPHLDVRIELPPGLEAVSAKLHLDRPDTRMRIVNGRDISLDPDSVTRIEALPAAELEVHLVLESKPLWRLDRKVDLSDGESREIVFRPRPIELSGTIYYGDEPTPGKVRIEVFDTKKLDPEGSSFEADVDDDGNYRALLYDEGRYFLHVDLPEVPGPEALILYAPWIREDTVFDLRVPRSSARVQVRDAATGEPVAGAQVLVYNEFVVDWIEPEEESSLPALAHSDEDGWAQLPPLYPGDLTVSASKEGYLEMSEKIRARLHPGETPEFAIALQPIGETATLSLRLPDGRPAGGAEIRAQHSTWNEPPIWEGRADRQGRVQLPADAEGAWLLVRHPEAGSWVDRWSPTQNRATTWSLPSSAGPVRFLTQGLDGEPVPWTSLAVRFPATWTAGNTLAWLTGSRVAASHANALWTAKQLPSQELAVYAGDATTLSLAIHGMLSGSATLLTPPWPDEPVEVPVSARQ